MEEVNSPLHENVNPENLLKDSRLESEIAAIHEASILIKKEVGKVVIGQEKMIDLMLVGLFTGGHVLLEGVPGIAKTVSAKMLAKTLSVGFSRIQFTPDLMPSDIVGTSVFNMKTSEFSFKQGPVFSNIILIDEINRSPAKTQAALFEVMEEKQVTVDGKTHKMEFPFFVIATQNPVEHEGTYKLPEAQLDRFLFKIKIDYPSLTEEQQILRRFKEDFDSKLTADVAPVINATKIKLCREAVEKVHIKDDLMDYIAKIVCSTRNNGDIFLGASTRASLAIMKASKAIAALNGRSFVTPDDIRFVAGPVLNHRIILSSDRELEGTKEEEVINGLIQKVEVPR